MWNQLFRHARRHDAHLLYWPHFALSTASHYFALSHIALSTVLHYFALSHIAETYYSVYDLSHPSGCTGLSLQCQLHGHSCTLSHMAKFHCKTSADVGIKPVLVSLYVGSIIYCSPWLCGARQVVEKWLLAV